eukprot:Gb_01758 [translate_table: standard]
MTSSPHPFSLVFPYLFSRLVSVSFSALCLEDRPDAAERRPTRERITHLRGTRDGHLEAHYDLHATPARPNIGEGNPIGSRRIHSTCLPRFGKDLVFIILESADWRRKEEHEAEGVAEPGFLRWGPTTDGQDGVDKPKCLWFRSGLVVQVWRPLPPKSPRIHSPQTPSLVPHRRGFLGDPSSRDGFPHSAPYHSAALSELPLHQIFDCAVVLATAKVIKEPRVIAFNYLVIRNTELAQAPAISPFGFLTQGFTQGFRSLRNAQDLIVCIAQVFRAGPPPHPVDANIHSLGLERRPLPGPPLCLVGRVVIREESYQNTSLRRSSLEFLFLPDAHASIWGRYDIPDGEPREVDMKIGSKISSSTLVVDLAAQDLTPYTKCCPAPTASRMMYDHLVGSERAQGYHRTRLNFSFYGDLTRPLKTMRKGQALGLN